MTFMTDNRGFCFIAALTNLATDLNIFMESEPRGNVGSSPTLLVSPGCIGSTLSEAVKCKKKSKIGKISCI